MQPGVYQMSFRGLTLAEAWRFGKEPFKFTVALVLKAIAFKGPKQWLPPHECETACEEAGLSAGAREHLIPVVQTARSLGYTTGRFSVLSRNLDENTKEGYSYLALHDDRMRGIFIAYLASTATGSLQPTVVSTGILSTEQNPDISFVNHRNYMDGVPEARVVRVSGAGIVDLDNTMMDFMRQSRSPVRRFSSLAALTAHGREMDAKNFDARIARGLYQYLGGA